MYGCSVSGQGWEQGKGFQDPAMVCFYWRCMLSAVAAVHKEGIVHSDLKPANFLIVAGILKLIDFGSSLRWGRRVGERRRACRHSLGCGDEQDERDGCHPDGHAELHEPGGRRQRHEPPLQESRMPHPALLFPR